VFSGGYGAVSGLLASRLFRHVGTISYSVYLLHQPLQELLMVCAVWCYVTLGWSWMLAVDPSTTSVRLGASAPVGDAITAVMLIILLAASTLTWRLVETPCRSWVRARVSQGRVNRR
jgi:peptidoglycan/LPS O-acetylase OafA/YrhL